MLTVVLMLIAALVAYGFAVIQPNGDAIMWHRKLKWGHCYEVLALTDCHDFGMPKEVCALATECGKMYNPFSILLPPQKDCLIEVGDMIAKVREKGIVKLKVSKVNVLVSQMPQGGFPWLA